MYDCTFLCAGYDTLEESASVFIRQEVWQQLEEAKEYARERNHGSNQAYTTTLGGMEFQIKPHGGAGVTFILSNDRFTLAIRPSKTPYNLSVTYRARTLWEYGPEEARKMIWRALDRATCPRPPDQNSDNPEAEITKWRKVSRIDYAFDFHAPEFSEEIAPDMIERVICHSSSKWRWDFKTADEEGAEIDGYAMGRGGRVQTLTVGKKGGLQIQVYKKCEEITEKSQKTWMYKVWEAVGLERPASGRHSDIWRIEVRMGREFLNDRGVDTVEDFEAQKARVLAEALKSRRLTDKTGDSNRRRWPVHPMWAQAIQMADNSMTLIDLRDHVETSGAAAEEKMRQDLKAIMRRQHALRIGGDQYDRDSAYGWLVSVLAEMERDDNHHEKMEEYAERYKYVNCPM